MLLDFSASPHPSQPQSELVSLRFGIENGATVCVRSVAADRVYSHPLAWRIRRETSVSVARAYLHPLPACL